MSSPTFSGTARLLFLLSQERWVLMMISDDDDMEFTPVPLHLAQALKDQGIPDATTIPKELIPTHLRLSS